MELQVVETTLALEQAIHRFGDEPAYAFDTEFSSSKTYVPRLCLVQIAWPEHICLVDPFTVDLAPLSALFSSPAVAIAHSAQNDLEVLDPVVPVRPSSLFDTQVAAELLGMAERSLGALTSTLLSVDLDKAEQLRDWTARPLSEAALTYAALDVAHLFDLRTELLADLATQGRLEAMEQECEAVRIAPRPPVVFDECWWHLRDWNTLPASARPYAQQLAKAREVVAIQCNLPKRHVLRDAEVLRLATTPPRSVAKARSMLQRRDLPQGLPEAIVEAVLLADGLDPASVPLPLRHRSDRDARNLLAALQALTLEVAEAEQIVPVMVASRSDFVARLNGQPSRLDRPWRASVITERADALIAAWREGTLPEPRTPREG